MKSLIATLLLCVACAAQTAPPAPPDYPGTKPGDFTVPGFHFKSGDQLDVRMHYYAIGEPRRDSTGRVTNAVLILHGTGGTGRQFFSRNFADVLFGPGQLLDVTKYYVILVDSVGHGKSSKPSDGMRMKFPHYDYDDMVALQHDLLVQGLGVNHLRLVMGTSMGCMHSWVWAEMYPDFMDGAMPLACNPTELAGRNRTWRKMLMDGIRADPAWNNGDYKEQPKQGLTLAEDFLILVGMAPLFQQTSTPTREATDRPYETRLAAAVRNLDANDLLYQVDSSRNYNPEPKLESIRVPVMAVNSADDFINPPELGILERDIKRVKYGTSVVIPISDQTRGHGTHTLPAIWGALLAKELQDTGGIAPGTSWTGQPAPQTGVNPLAGMSVYRGAPQSSGVYQVGNGVTAPHATYQPDPQYSEEALQARLQGTVVLWVVIGPEGRVRDVKVQRSLGMGLDEKAIDAIKRWQFAPATRDGQPVPVQVNIEVNFHLPPGPGGPAPTAAQPAVGAGVYRVGPGITPPQKLQGAEPGYTEYARQQKIEGTVIVSVVVAADGTVQGAKVQKSLEASLDQSAVETIKTWRFRPGMKDGQPVAVQLSIETSFRLY